MRGPKKSEVAPQIRTGVSGYGLVLDCLECAMECKEVGFDLALGIHLKNLVAMATYHSFFSNCLGNCIKIHKKVMFC